MQVISAGEAVGLVLGMVQDSDLMHRNQRPLMATLMAAVNAFERGQLHAGLRVLQAFQNQVHAQVAPFNPALAGDLTAAAQTIVDALTEPAPGARTPGKPPTRSPTQ